MKGRQPTIPVFAWKARGKPQNTCQDNRYTSQDSNRTPPDYKSALLLLHQPLQQNKIPYFSIDNARVIYTKKV